jgi:hypothetical protein
VMTLLMVAWSGVGGNSSGCWQRRPWRALIWI